MHRYEISKKIGEGTGGVVFLAAIVEPSPAAAEYGLKAGKSALCLAMCAGSALTALSTRGAGSLQGTA